MFSSSCQDEFSSKKNKVIMLVQCLEFEFENPFNPNAKISRNSIGWWVTLIDLLCITVFLMAFYVQSKVNDITVNEFKEDVLHMNDFAIEVWNLPPRKEYK